MLTEFMEQHKTTWNHVLHGDGSVMENMEVGTEIAATISAAVLMRNSGLIKGLLETTSADIKCALPQLEISAPVLQMPKIQATRPPVYYCAQANEALTHGDKHTAAALFEQGLDNLRAGRLYEECGDVPRAFEIAVKTADHGRAATLASKYKIAGYEFLALSPRHFLQHLHRKGN